MTNTEIMIDIETLGISHNSIILTIGVVKFTRDTLKENINQQENGGNVKITKLNTKLLKILITEYL